MGLRKELAACWPESCFLGSPDATANSFFLLGIADGALAPEVWVGNGVPTLPWNRVVSLQSRLSVFHGRDDHAPFFLYATAALREVWVHDPFLICSSFLAGVVQISR